MNATANPGQPDGLPNPRDRAGLTVTVLGMTAPYPGPRTIGPGYLIEGFGCRLLLDCGSGVLSRMLEYCDYVDLDAVILSHLHFDHCSDMFSLGYALDVAVRTGRMAEPLPVYCPAKPKEVAAFMTYKEAMVARTIVPNVPTDIAGLTATFLPMRHPVETYGVILRPSKAPAIGSLFFYTGDTQWFEELPDQVGRCEIVIAEATLTRKQAVMAPAVGHLTAWDAARLGGMVDAGVVILSHLPPDRKPEDVIEEASHALARPIIVASEGLRVLWP